MKTNKDFKSHINYFKKSDSLKYIGIVLAVLGVFLYMFGWGYVSYIIATVALPIGGVLFIIGSSGRASDSDINEYIAKRTEGIEIDLENNPNIKKRLLKQIPIETIEGYEYKDGLMVTKAKDGSIRSAEYTKSVLYSLSDALHIVSRRISLVSDETHEEDIEILYSDLSDIRIENNDTRLTFGKKVFKASDVRLVIKYSGEKSLSLPARDNASLDNFIEMLKRAMSNNK
jgi:hypothetical protein